MIYLNINKIFKAIFNSDSVLIFAVVSAVYPVFLFFAFFMFYMNGMYSAEPFSIATLLCYLFSCLTLANASRMKCPHTCTNLANALKAFAMVAIFGNLFALAVLGQGLWNIAIGKIVIVFDIALVIAIGLCVQYILKKCLVS